MLVRSSTLLLALALAGPAAAQAEAWKIPHRGAAEYHRRVHDLFVAPLGEDNRSGIRQLVAGGGFGGTDWRYRQYGGAPRDDGYQLAEHDDSAWATGTTPFGDSGQRTAWPQDRRYLDARTRFEHGRRKPRAAVLQIDHDDVATVFLNGIQIYRGGQYQRGVVVSLGPDALDAFLGGENVLAVRIDNTGGASYFDLALTVSDRTFRDPEQALRLVREQAAGAGRAQRGLFPDFRAGRHLCQGQLTPDGTGMARPPIDLRDLPAFLAFDLQRTELSGPMNGAAPRMFRFGDVTWRGRAESPDATGLQRLHFDLRSEPARVQGDDKRFVEQFVRGPHGFTHDMEGTLDIERRFDPDKGAVTWFRSRLSARIAARSGGDAGVPFELTHDEEWTLKRLRDNRDVDFEEAVRDAIARGTQKLKTELSNLGKPVLRNEPSGNRTYNTGRLALALLALLHAEVPREDPVVAKAVAELRKRRLVDTYSTAHAIMAMERYYAPKGEAEELRAGTLDRPRKRQPSEADRALLQRWANILLNNIDTRVDRSYLLRFNYTRGGRYDNSVNQYGLLGLYAAHLCGIDIPVTVWEAAANHLIEDQDRPGSKVDLELKSYVQLQSERRGNTTSAGSRGVPAAGWSYHATKHNGVPQPVYGAMTCAGIAGLTICLAGIRDADVTRSALAARGERTIAQGFAWLAENFSLHSNASRVHQPYYWVYYYLYGLERACELSGVAVINDRDWYYEGALTLMDAQWGAGGWPDDLHPDEIMERTAMAVLFLKKSSAPVYTQRD